MRKKTSTKNKPGRGMLAIDSVSKIVAIIASVWALATSVMWVKTENINKLLDSKLKGLEIEIKRAGIAETELRNAQLKPSFSVQYLIFGNEVYATISQGYQDYDSATGKNFKNLDAKDAFESLYYFPLVETGVEAQMAIDKIEPFLKKFIIPRNKKLRVYDAIAWEYTILSLSCYGGTAAKDVELIYEERTFPHEPFIFPPEGHRYREGAHVYYKDGAPVQSEELPYIRKQGVIKLGDIKPGRGRLIPIQVALRPELPHTRTIQYTDFFVAISSYHIKPMKIRYKTLTGEIIEQPIREQLNIPMPISELLAGRA